MDFQYHSHDQNCDIVTLVNNILVRIQTRMARMFMDQALRLFFLQHWDPAIPGLNTSLINEEKVNEWSEVQRSQHLLTNGASFLCGIRLQVYRAEGTTQWYTAVTTGFNTGTMVRSQKISSNQTMFLFLYNLFTILGIYPNR